MFLTLYRHYKMQIAATDLQDVVTELYFMFKGDI